jgi:DNA-binding NtrC family response regulator
VLQSYDWPGNVRELANTIHKALIFSRGAPIRHEDIVQARGGELVAKEAGGAAHEDLIRQWLRKSILSEGASNTFETLMDRCASILISEALNLTDGNRSQAARLLGLSRPTLHSKIEKFNLKFKTSVKEED